MSDTFPSDVRQTALIDDAEQTANRLRLPEYEDVRQLYAIIGFDVMAFANELDALADAARNARNQAAAEQADYQTVTGGTRQLLPRCQDWLDTLLGAGRYARVRRQPLGDSIANLAATREFSPASWSQARDAVGSSLALLRGRTLADSGLADDFLAQGETLYAELEQRRLDEEGPRKDRMTQTAALHAALDAIEAKFEEILAARELVMLRTKKRLPGVELTLVRGAAAGRSARPEEPAPAPAPEGSSAGDTGL